MLLRERGQQRILYNSRTQRREAAIYAPSLVLPILPKKDRPILDSLPVSQQAAYPPSPVNLQLTGQHSSPRYDSQPTSLSIFPATRHIRGDMMHRPQEQRYPSHYSRLSVNEFGSIGETLLQALCFSGKQTQSRVPRSETNSNGWGRLNSSYSQW